MKFTLFGGKGGVGKTTCAAASAIQMAEAGHKTFLISTDPAHSVSDSLEMTVGPQPIYAAANLTALEISAEKLFLKFKEEHGEDIKRILETGTYLDEQDVESLFSLSIPGLDEVMALVEILRLMEQGDHEYYILDTCPTGHALRLLALPELLDQWIHILARIRYKYHVVVSHLARRDVHESADDFLFTLKKSVKKIQELMRDPGRCEFVVVTIPEVMALKESQHLVSELERLGIPVRHLIVNHLVPADRDTCPACRERRQEQRQVMEEYNRLFPRLKIFPLLERPHQIKGIQSLRELDVPLQAIFRSGPEKEGAHGKDIPKVPHAAGR